MSIPILWFQMIVWCGKWSWNFGLAYLEVYFYNLLDIEYTQAHYTSISQEICTRFFALLCFVVVIHWLIFSYPSGLLHWHCGNLTIAPVPAKQPWWIRINTSFEFIMNDYITTQKPSTTKPCAYLLGYTVLGVVVCDYIEGLAVILVRW